MTGSLALLLMQRVMMSGMEHISFFEDRPARGILLGLLDPMSSKKNEMRYDPPRSAPTRSSTTQFGRVI
jgi:hypothetical protein